MGAAIIFATPLIALGGHVLFRRVFPVMLDAEQRSMTIAMMTAVATISSLLAAFSAISVWGAYQAATDIVATKAACATGLIRDLSAFLHPNATATRSELVTYLQHVVRNEWPNIQWHAHPDANTEAALDIMFATANRIVPRDGHERMLPVEVLACVNGMAKYREERLQNLETAMPDTLWGMVLIASGLLSLLLYALSATRFHMALVAVWVTTFGLTFFSMLVVDRPSTGEVSVSAAPLGRAIQTLSNDRPQAHPRLD